MPHIDLIPELLYQAMDPYHYEADNRPLQNIYARQNLINIAVDENSEQIREASGTAGSLQLRLTKALDADGDLRKTAVDATYHSIGAHADGNFDDGSGTKYYVRMLKEERDKLALITDEATNFGLEVELPSTVRIFDNDQPLLRSTDTITWEVESPNIIKARTTFPLEVVHRHYYEVKPLRQNSSDYKNWKIASSPMAFVPGTLAVYVEGIRVPRSLSTDQGDSDDESRYAYVPPVGASKTGSWLLLTYTADAETGTFTFNQNLDSSHSIFVDFSVELS